MNISLKPPLGASGTSRSSASKAEERWGRSRQLGKPLHRRTVIESRRGVRPADELFLQPRSTGFGSSGPTPHCLDDSPSSEEHSRREIGQVGIKRSGIGPSNSSPIPHALYSSMCSSATLHSLTTMLFSGNIFTVLLVIAVVGVIGSPVELERRAPGGDLGLGSVSYCDGGGFAQPCQSPIVQDGECMNVTEDLLNKMSAFMPSYGIGCTLYV